MGIKNWDSDDWASYKKTNISNKATAQQIYTANNLNPLFDPMNVMRESCDSVNHPNSTPIIMGLDVTGSMSSILKVTAEKCGMVMEEIITRQPVPHPQILFAGIGDSASDEVPFQVTQFESDISIAQQLTQVYFEGNGGGNGRESYPLTWWFAAKHTKCDNYLKRNQKGFIFTFGDDGYPACLTRRELKEIFGDTVEDDVPVKDVLAMANRQWDIYHFCMMQGSTYRDSDFLNWQKLLGENAIKVKNYEKIPELIVSILELHAGKSVQDVVASWDGTTQIAVGDALSGLSIAKNPAAGLVKF